MERGFCEVRAPEKVLSGDGGQQGKSHISWNTLARPVAWEILLPQVPASLQTLWSRELSHLSLSHPSLRKAQAQGTMLSCSRAVISEWPLVWGPREQEEWLGSKERTALGAGLQFLCVP